MRIALSVALPVLSGLCVAEPISVPSVAIEQLLEELEDDSDAEVVEEVAEPEVVAPVVQPPANPKPVIRQPEPEADPMVPHIFVTDPAKTPPVVEGAEREMTPEELAALEAIKPGQPEQAPEVPEDLADAPEVLIPIYASLAKRTPESDWVTAQFKQPLVPREQTRVAVLGYHDFSNTKSVTEMRMRTAEFCRQMQFLKDSDICVISMQDFLDWRFGTRCLPEKCVLITIDDGWKTVYSDAYPVLKAYGYPFTLFLYVRYVEVEGSSMTRAQIQEMQACGATIGSHSWNHHYPSKWKAHAPTSDTYATMLQKELVDSRTKLKEWFGTCSTFCYPGGYHTEPMRNTLAADACEAAFTVIESKVQCDVDAHRINRYMVFGNDTSIFRRAVNFAGQEGVDPTITAINEAEAPARAFLPSAFTGVDSPLTQNEKTAEEKAAAAKAAKEAAAAEAENTDSADAPEVPEIIQDPAGMEPVAESPEAVVPVPVQEEALQVPVQPITPSTEAPVKTEQPNKAKKKSKNKS